MDKGLYYRYSERFLMGMEYNMMRICYDDQIDKKDKIRLILSQYAKAINQFSSELLEDKNQLDLTPEQVEELFTGLGATYVKYDLKVRGIQINQQFKDLFKNMDEDLKDDIRDLCDFIEENGGLDNEE